MAITQSLLYWYSKNARDLPWRHTKDPYIIWISEVILQQTRVEQGLPYFLRIIERYPNLDSLAESSEQELLKLWQGLGYYSRARNLLEGAVQLVQRHNAVFPSDYDELLKIKGIGPYTAAAIASFAFDKPHPVMDGNVSRVISRLFAIEKPINSSAGIKELKASLDRIFDSSRPAIFNQAMMELGSMICKPQNPDCDNCPVRTNCMALETGIQMELPLKEKKTRQKHVYLNYFFIKTGKNTFLQKRSSGFWKNLYEFPLIEGNQSEGDLIGQVSEFMDFRGNFELELSWHTRHILSHRILHIDFYTINVQVKPKPLNSSIFEIDLNELEEQYPVPVPIALFIKKI